MNKGLKKKITVMIKKIRRSATGCLNPGKVFPTVIDLGVLGPRETRIQVTAKQQVSLLGRREGAREA